MVSVERQADGLEPEGIDVRPAPGGEQQLVDDDRLVPDVQGDRVPVRGARSSSPVSSRTSHPVAPQPRDHLLRRDGLRRGQQPGSADQQHHLRPEPPPGLRQFAPDHPAAQHTESARHRVRGGGVAGWSRCGRSPGRGSVGGPGGCRWRRRRRAGRAPSRRRPGPVACRQAGPGRAAPRSLRLRPSRPGSASSQPCAIASRRFSTASTSYSAVTPGSRRAATTASAVRGSALLGACTPRGALAADQSRLHEDRRQAGSVRVVGGVLADGPGSDDDDVDLAGGGLDHAASFSRPAAAVSWGATGSSSASSREGGRAIAATAASTSSSPSISSKGLPDGALESRGLRRHRRGVVARDGAPRHGRGEQHLADARVVGEPPGAQDRPVQRRRAQRLLGGPFGVQVGRPPRHRHGTCRAPRRRPSPRPARSAAHRPAWRRRRAAPRPPGPRCPCAARRWSARAPAAKTTRPRPPDARRDPSRLPSRGRARGPCRLRPRRHPGGPGCAPPP